MVFKLTVSVLGICHLLGLHFYLLISLLSSRAPNSSLHHSFSFLRDAVCRYQTWSRYLISDGQCCWCLNILLGLTSNPLDFVNLICTPHFGSFSQISAKWDPLLPFAFLTLWTGRKYDAHISSYWSSWLMSAVGTAPASMKAPSLVTPFLPSPSHLLSFLLQNKV